MSKAFDPAKLVENKTAKVEPGRYAFTVESASWKTNKNGNEYVSLELKVDAGKGIRVFDSLYTTDKALWRVKAFMEAVGMDFSDPPEKDYLPVAFAGKLGGASFITGDRGYLEVEYFLSPSEAAELGNTQKPNEATAGDSESVPW